jgi:hypothetical protein
MVVRIGLMLWRTRTRTVDELKIACTWHLKIAVFAVCPCTRQADAVLNTYLPGVCVLQRLLVRLVDDYLMVTDDRVAAERFLSEISLGLSGAHPAQKYC